MKFRLVILTLLFFGAVAAVRAHDPGFSVTKATLENEKIRMTVRFSLVDVQPFVDVDNDGDRRIDEGEFDRGKAVLAAWVLESLVFEDGNEVAVPAVTAVENETDGVRFELTLGRSDKSTLTFSAPVLSDLAHGHRHYLTVRSVSGEILLQALLSRHADTVAIPGRG